MPNISPINANIKTVWMSSHWVEQNLGLVVAGIAL